MAKSDKIKQREEEARESYELVKEVFRNMPGYVIFVGEDGRIKFANENAARLAGYEKAEDVVGLRPTDIAVVHGSYAEAAKELMKAIKERRKVENLEMKLVSASGREFFASASVYPVFVGGEFVGSIEVFMDITDERRKEMELEEILNKLPVAAFVIGTDHKVKFWNRACEDITGVKAEEIVGTNRQWYPF
ncbi:MAG: PAS domain S-box protein, partial [Archaeoglobaceae archaeon]